MKTMSMWRRMSDCGSKKVPSRKVNWNSEQIHTLLECCREFPILWDPAHEQFSKILLKKSHWRDIAEKLKHEFPELAAINLTGGDVQARFAIVKGCFQREVKKIHNTPGLSGGVRPKWEFFDACSYMLPHNEWSATTASSISSNSSANSGPPRKRKKINNSVDQKIAHAFTAINGILDSEPPKSTLVKHTVSTIASYLSALKDERQKDVAAKLLNVIHNEPPLSPDDFALN
ncbi:uncharacterized protein LOC143018192 [Oratosquilla oratoria]|uniref:uncharacterized protein LOC143018192 n=1 Tax=Oratosquilla oratoria TaxID=337810 RepID=UPI003F767902